MKSGIGRVRLTNQIRNMYDLTNYAKSVLIGLLLSDGWLILSYSKNEDKSKLNARLRFSLSFDKFNYFFFVFNVMSPYCSNLPSFRIKKRNNTTTYSLDFFTQAFPCITRYYSLFYKEKNYSSRHL